MFETLAETLLVGLKLWQTKESRKYIDRAIKLRKEYRDEYNKDPAHRSDAILDNIESELRGLAIAFTTSVGTSDPSDQS